MAMYLLFLVIDTNGVSGHRKCVQQVAVSLHLRNRCGRTCRCATPSAKVFDFPNQTAMQ